MSRTGLAHAEAHPACDATRISFTASRYTRVSSGVHPELQADIQAPAAMNAVLSNSLIAAYYGLGLVGLLGIALLPLRAIATGRRIRLWHSSSFGRAMLYLFGAVAFAAIIFSAFQVAGAVQCLSDANCSATRGGGWFFLALLGGCYIAFEMFSFSVLYMLRKHVTPNYR